MVSYEEVDSLLKMNGSELVWKCTGQGRKRDCAAGHYEKNGYGRICIKGKKYSMSWLSWMLHKKKFPDHQIDHIDGNPKNNHIDNLRDVSQYENMRNRKKLRSNTSGYTGICWGKDRNRWLASIRCNSKVYQKRFINIEDAAKWRLEMENKLGFTERHGKD